MSKVDTRPTTIEQITDKEFHVVLLAVYMHARIGRGRYDDLRDQYWEKAKTAYKEVWDIIDRGTMLESPCDGVVLDFTKATGLVFAKLHNLIDDDVIAFYRWHDDNVQEPRDQPNMIVRVPRS